MRLVSYNIQYGKGKDERFDLARICAAVDGADVIALQEVERHWPRSGDQDQPAEIARLLGGRYHWIYGPGFDVDASFGTPGSRRRQFGNMLLSRWPLLSSRHHLLPKMGLTRQFSLQRSVIEGVIAPPGSTPLRVHSLHLSHVGDGDRAPQVERLLELHRQAPLEGGAWCGTHREDAWTLGLPPPPMPAEAVYMGDFNLAPDSPLYARLAGPWSTDFGRMSHTGGLVDAFVAAGHAENDPAHWTCDSCEPPQPRRRIDHAFVSTELASRVARAWIDQDAAGSDHQPLWVELVD
jgi:endonuclease/exonuclease/phosphatase family metal-dependent hydrolase